MLGCGSVLLMMSVASAGGCYSFCGNTERNGNNLTLDFAEAAAHIASAGARPSVCHVPMQQLQDMLLAAALLTY